MSIYKSFHRIKEWLHLQVKKNCNFPCNKTAKFSCQVVVTGCSQESQWKLKLVFLISLVLQVSVRFLLNSLTTYCNKVESLLLFYFIFILFYFILFYFTTSTPKRGFFKMETSNCISWNNVTFLVSFCLVMRNWQVRIENIEQSTSSLSIGVF